MALLALPPLTTGAGLVIYIVAGLSLPLAVGLVALIGLGVTWIVWRQTPATIRPILKHRAMVGLQAGIIATIAYDVCRYIFVTFLHFSFWPFDIFSIFGRLLIGDSAPATIAVAVGVLFHYANGIGFALGYVLLFRRPSIVTGLIWAAVLELFMVSLYPGWLGLKALDEFLSVSIFGHVVYGTVLGAFTRRRLSPSTRDT